MYAVYSTYNEITIILELWGALLSHARDSEELTPLIYPLTQVN